jgi:hypothetical protein
MRNFLFIVLLNLASASALAQIPSMGNRGGGMQNMNMGRFYGRILDKATNKPVDAASVQLVQNRFDTVTKKRKDFVVGGQLTRSNGEFNLEGLPVMGQFKLKITAIGYVALEQPVKFEVTAPTLELAVDMLEMAPQLDHVVLFSGDGDFRRLVEAVQRMGVRVTVVSTVRSQPPMIADELRRQGDAFLVRIERRDGQHRAKHLGL